MILSQADCIFPYGAAGVLAFTETGKVFVVREERKGTLVRGIPNGRRDSSDFSPMHTAIREFAEESGFIYPNVELYPLSLYFKGKRNGYYLFFASIDEYNDLEERFKSRPNPDDPVKGVEYLSFEDLYHSTSPPIWENMKERFAMSPYLEALISLYRPTTPSLLLPQKENSAHLSECTEEIGFCPLVGFSPPEKVQDLDSSLLE